MAAGYLQYLFENDHTNKEHSPALPEPMAFNKTIDSSQNLIALRSFLYNSYHLIARTPILEFTFLFGSRSRENGGIRAVLPRAEA
ncbi:hypothetical protein E2C01_004438 [Portunus trituberculatus]|uniref:Uncharacterized protein n=1 Tax=Portunus trituberculatus TaxID=210409 RepID=A0A5B7CWD3_PORTR|nr:hypothetical protein [Portunus trituberculatus]